MIPLATLIEPQSTQDIYDVALEVARDLSLPVDSWQTGDPTRSLYWILAEVVAALESTISGYASSGFLEWAAADSGRYQWLVHMADQVYGYTAREATYATGVVTLSNGGGGLFVIEAGDITVKSAVTGKTYHNTSGGTLASGPGTTLDVDIVADESGSDSSASATEIDTMITTLLSVTCSNAAAVVGDDAELASSIVAGCRAKLGTISGCGPAGAYDYVARASELTGTTAVTRSRAFASSTTGEVLVYLAGPSGAVGAADVALVEAAILTWATPLCITPTVASAAALTIDVTYELWVYDTVGMTSAEIETAVELELSALFAVRPIGGDVKGSVGSGYLYLSMIESCIRAAFPEYFVDVTVTLPATDQIVAANEIPMLGTVTATAIHLEAAP